MIKLNENKNKTYCKHLDKKYTKSNYSKTILENYKLSKHFLMRCKERNISLCDVSKTIKKGNPFYVVENDNIKIKYVLKKMIVIIVNNYIKTAYISRTIEVEPYRGETSFIFE